MRIVHPDVFRIVEHCDFKADVLLREAWRGDVEALVAVWEGGASVENNWIRSPSPVSLTDENGNFRIEVLASWLQPGCFDGLQVVAMVPGLGSAWKTVTKEDECKDVSLSLVEDVPISGRIIGQDGKPVPNATIRMGTILDHWPSTIDIWQEAIRAYVAGNDKRFNDLFNHKLKRFPGDRLQGIHRILKTDDDGCFKVAGIGVERVVLGIEVYADGIGKDVFSVVTGNLPRLELPSGTRALWPSLRTYGAEFEHTIATSRSITGSVQDNFWDRGISGAVVAASGPTDITCLTDRNGKYELVGLPNSESLIVTVKPSIPISFPVLPPSAGYPHCSTCVDTTDDDKSGSVDFDLWPGVVVHGHIRDKATGLPIAGATVCYAAQTGNPLLEGMFTYDGQRETKDGSARRSLQLCEIRTKSGYDGTYRIVGLPGFGFLVVSVPGEVYLVLSDKKRLRWLKKYSVPNLSGRLLNSVRKIDLPDVPSFTVDLWLRRS